MTIKPNDNFDENETVSDPSFREKLNEIAEVARTSQSMFLTSIDNYAPGVTAYHDSPIVEDLLPPNVSNKWLGSITSIAATAGFTARWDYTVQRVKLVDLDSTPSGTKLGYEILTGEDALSVTAYNLLELGHIAEPSAATPWYIWGVDVHATDYDNTGFIPMPVGGGGTGGLLKINQIVEITECVITNNTTDPNGPPTKVVYTFSAMGSHDGGCS